MFKEFTELLAEYGKNKRQEQSRIRNERFRAKLTAAVEKKNPEAICKLEKIQESAKKRDEKSRKKEKPSRRKRLRSLGNLKVAVKQKDLESNSKNEVIQKFGEERVLRRRKIRKPSRKMT